ncbi:MAG: hypothetical protein KC473_02600 [Candidatus Dadabacteria bacterium]|nr:hypothetical protein [Candidatus Dadabacteria bacterium]
MRILRVLAVSLLFVFTGIGIIGGCGGGGGGGGQPTDAPPTTPPTAPPTTPPTAPPTAPPTECLVPPLNTNFSNTLYFFVDETTNIAMGITSDGEEVLIAASDIIPDPTIFLISAIPVSSDVALVDFTLVDDILFDASGDVVRLDNGAVLQLNDFIAGGVPLGVDVEGECDSFEPLDTSSLSSVRQFVNDFAQTKGLSDSGVDIMEDFAFDVLNNGE